MSTQLHIKILAGDCMMRKYGMPKDVDPKDLRRKIDGIFRELDVIRKNPDFQQELEISARISGGLSASDLENQFTI